MSAPAFTPGPWVVQDEDDRQSEDTFPVFSASGFEVCEAYGWETVRHPLMTVAEGEANARLIAAAPELYEALETLASISKGLVGSAYIHDAETALAKARGDQ